MILKKQRAENMSRTEKLCKTCEFQEITHRSSLSGNWGRCSEEHVRKLLDIDWDAVDFCNDSPFSEDFKCGFWQKKLVKGNN